MRFLMFAIAVLLVIPAAVQAVEQCTAGHGLSPRELGLLEFPDYRKQVKKQTLGDAALRLRAVRFFRQNVFPDRNHWLARQANRFNIVTKEAALKTAFPIAIGETVNEIQRQEAERVLREKAYLYDALVLVRRVCGAEVDLDVVVRDVWTLTPRIGFSRSGGDNETNLGLSDVNFLGSGKSLSLEYFDDRNRTGTSIEYDDPNLFGTRWTGSLIASDNDDGERYGLALVHPFFALDTPFAAGFSANHFVRNQDLDFLGKEAFEIDADTDVANVFVAASKGRRNGWVNRYFLGARYLDENFVFPSNFPGVQHDSRTFAYPYVGWQLLQDRYVERADVDRVGVTEDLKLGWSSYAEAGWSTDGFGGKGDYLLSRASVAYRRYVGEDHLLGFSARITGRYDLDRHRSEDVQFVSRLTYLWRQAPRWQLLTSATYNQTHNLPEDKQLTLGGDNGLRGYPSRYQIGDRSYLVTLEERYYSNAYPFGLFRVGYAAFVDVGRAWYEDEPPAWVPPRSGDQFDTLTNVGIGLRLESIRTRRDRVIHIDIAKPLVDGPFIDSYEFTISAKQTF